MFRAPAEAYDRHIGRYGASLSGALCSAAGVAPGQRALDVGCGPGALAAELADRLGAGAVAAVDPSPPFAEGCRARLPGVDVSVAPAEHLPFGDSAFDRTLAQLVVNFMSDPGAGVAEMVRVTRRGGVVGAAVWDYAGEMTLLRRFWDAAVALDPAAGALDEGVSMPYCQPESLAGLWAGAGLAGVAVSEALARADYAGFDDLWGGLETGVGPAGAYLVGLPAEARSAVRARTRALLAVPDGPFSLTARAWVVTGRVG